MLQETLLYASTDGVTGTDSGGRLLPLKHTEQRLLVIPYYWDPIGLTYVVAQQASGGAGGGGAATIADGADVAEGAKADAAWSGVGSGSVIAVLKALYGKLAGTLTVSGPLTDTQLRAAPVPVSAAALPLPAGASTEATLALIKAKTDNLDVLLSTRTKPADVQKVDPSGVTSPVSLAVNTPDVTDRAARLLGHVTVDSSVLPTGAAADATLTGGTAKAIARGGQKGTTNTNADITHTPSGANHEVLDVAIYDAAGNLKDPTQIRALTNADVVKAQLQDNAGTAVTVGQKAAASSLPVVLPNDANGATQASATFIRPRKLVTYRALYRLAARPYALSSAFAAAGRKQYATIHHAAAATKLVKLRHVWVAVESSSVAALLVADLVRITTAPATGNPAITPSTLDSAAGAAEATCLALPTTAGTEGAIAAFVEWNLGVTAAGTVVNPPPPVQWIDLVSLVPGFDPDDEGTLPSIRAGILEGWAVTLDCSAIATEKAFAIIEFTEE